MGKNQLPPGFRFHPTDVELVKYHLKRKVLGKKLSFKAIADVDIYKYAPWDLPDMSYLKTGDLKWFFYCPIEKKYARGAKLNRATVCGYWKTTGKDRPVKYNEEVVGMIKTLVFHKGKAPHGDRTNWVMHEYRLEEKELTDRGVVQDTYVLCVVFKKDGMGPKNGAQYGAPFKEEDWSDDDEEEYTNLLGTSTLSSMSPAFGVACSSCVPESLCAGPSIESRGLFTLPPVIHTNAAVSVTCNIDSYAYGAPTFVDLESLRSRQSVESSGLFTLPPMVHTNTTISVPPMVHTNAAVSVTSDIHSNAYGAPAVDLESFGPSVESSELYTLPLVLHTNATISVGTNIDSNACVAPTCGDAPQVPVVTDAEVVPAMIDAPQLAQVHQVEESNDNILSMLDMFIEEEVMNTDEGQITGFVKAPQITDDDDIPSMLAYFMEDNYLNNVLYPSE